MTDYNQKKLLSWKCEQIFIIACSKWLSCSEEFFLKNLLQCATMHIQKWSQSNIY